MKKQTGDRKDTAGRDKGISLNLVINAINRNNGNITLTAKSLSCEKHVIYKMMETHPELREIISKARETIVDEAEESLLRNIKEGNIPSIIFALKTLGKSRGYNTTASKLPNWAAVLKEANLKKLTDEQLALLEKAIKKGKDPTGILIELWANAASV